MITQDLVCVFCDSTHFKPIYRDEYVLIVRCEQCGLVRQANCRAALARLDCGFESLECYYRTRKTTGRRALQLDTQKIALTSDIRRQVASRLGGSGKLLDVGCGRGEFLVSLSEIGLNVIGVEPDSMLATWVQEQYEVQVINAMYHSRLFSKRVFDAVTFIQVLEHLENPLEILCAAYSHLKPGGLLVVDVPSFNNPRVIAYRATRCKRLVRMDFIPSHCHYYTRRTLVNLVREAGFQVVRVETGRYGVKFGKQGLMIKMIDRIACWLGVGGITLYAVKSEGRQR